ncbi:MAG TPA: hypothetical protein VFU02_10330, partial [Polyangiaceae bacterium]|nr:hypothetical protein [Polyangiaceae bacterium]
MRQRRVERCVLRAETALQAGNEDEAREALEEARALDASAPEFESLRAAVAGREREQELPHDGPRSGRRLALAASLLLVTAVGVGAAVWQRVSSPFAPVTVPTSGVTESQSHVPPAPIQPQTTQLDVVPAKSDLVRGTAPVPADSPPPVSTPEFSPVSFTAPVGREVEIAVPTIPATE